MSPCHVRSQLAAPALPPLPSPPSSSGAWMWPQFTFDSEFLDFKTVGTPLNSLRRLNAALSSGLFFGAGQFLEWRVLLCHLCCNEHGFAVQKASLLGTGTGDGVAWAATRPEPGAQAALELWERQLRRGKGARPHPVNQLVLGGVFTSSQCFGG